MTGWITRDAVLERLGIRAQSLYAYVSRGRIAASPDPADPRRSLYSAEDVAALASRRGRGRTRSAVASGTISWGEPVLETTISTVAHGRLCYRGCDSVELAANAGLEEAAEILLGARPVPADELPGSRLADAFTTLAALVPTASPSYGRSAAALVEEAAGLVGTMTCALGAVPARTAHQGFAAAWGRPAASEAIRRALVLLADHELNASTFATRVAASTGAPLPACLLAGLSTLSGPLHGAAATAAVRFVRAARAEGPASVVRRYLADARPLPGFGHPLYLGIDPRAAAILDSIQLDAQLDELRNAVVAETGQEPNVDFAIAALVSVHDLPDDAPIRLFAAARSVGWLAHAIEQVTTGGLIRPRARYIGPPSP
jgi:citrate synthase